MRRWRSLFGLVVLLCLMLSCAPLKLRKVRAGVDESVAQLPVLKGFDFIETENLEFSDLGPPTACYYARAFVVIGSSLPEMEALDVYSEALQSTGYYSRREQYPTSRVFLRGSNERVVVGIHEPYIGFNDTRDWAQWKATYSTIIYITVDYILPRRDDC